jgi:hypothetical protein
MTQPDIGPEAFAQLVDRITGDDPVSDAEFAAMLRDPAAYACAAELEMIWHLAGTLGPSMSSGSE